MLYNILSVISFIGWWAKAQENLAISGFQAADEQFLPKRCSFFPGEIGIFMEHLQNFLEA